MPEMIAHMHSKPKANRRMPKRRFKNHNYASIKYKDNITVINFCFGIPASLDKKALLQI